MKQRHLFFSALPFTVITVACSVLAANFASAASQTWDGDSGTDANWITATNWVAAAVPGSYILPWKTLRIADNCNNPDGGR